MSTSSSSALVSLARYLLTSQRPVGLLVSTARPSLTTIFRPPTATGLLEFQIPPQVSRYASFLFSFIGRGAFYIFVGSILLHDGVLRIIAGSIVGLIGVCYVVLEFIPSIEPPANMREADAGWGAEQV